jgi:hypothetical protein
MAGVVFIADDIAKASGDSIVASQRGVPFHANKTTPIRIILAPTHDMPISCTVACISSDSHMMPGNDCTLSLIRHGLILRSACDKQRSRMSC